MMSHGFVFVGIMLFTTVVVATPADEQKPLDCPANEMYYKCSLEKCYKTCDNLKIPPPCPAIASGCYQPSCECIDEYLRNNDGVCVPYIEC